jgi:hypothetical protein
MTIFARTGVDSTVPGDFETNQVLISWRCRARRTKMVFVTVLVYVLDAHEARMAKSPGAT